MIQLCRHLLHSGQSCQGAALKGTRFCRHHQQLKRALAPRPAQQPYTHQPLPFVFPEDRAALQLNYFLLLQALTEGKIDTRKAGTMAYILQGCSANLNKGPLVEPNPQNAVQNVILTPEGEEIAPPRTVLEQDEAEPVHNETCSCQKCAEQYRGAPPEQHHPDCQCGLCEESSDQNDSVQGSALSDQDESKQKAGSRGLGDQEAGSLNPAPRTAHAEKLYTLERAPAPHNDSYEEVRKKYEARRAARERAAQAGTEPPPDEPVHPSELEDEAERRYQAIMEQVEKNKQIANDIWERRFAHEDEQSNTTNLIADR
jgi:hypothetical protein